MAETIAASTRSLRRAEASQPQFLRRWLIVWVALLTVVTAVVVAFLVAITNTLASINSNLAAADTAVTGAGGDVKSLPDQVDRVNASLGGIDPALKPIPQQADAIIAALSSIDSKLKSTDGSLKDTSGVLRTVLGQAGDIRTVLVDADDPADKLGVQHIHRRVAFANGTGDTGWLGANPNSLTAAKADTANIIAGLTDVNKHLASICNSRAVQGPKAC
jgi:ABC-type transporter Mla subunit MlaD